MPLSPAITQKPVIRSNDTRFEIVIVSRSLAAANAIRAGNRKRRARSRIMNWGFYFLSNMIRTVKRGYEHS